MTKSVQTKLVLILVLLIVATMLIVGAVMVNRVSTFYDNDFEKQMSSFFDEQLVELENAGGRRGSHLCYAAGLFQQVRTRLLPHPLHTLCRRECFEKLQSYTWNFSRTQ